MFSIAAPTVSGRPRFDAPGAALVVVPRSVAFGSVEPLARSPLWTPMLVVAGLAAGAGFVVRQRRAASSLIPPRVFANREVADPIGAAGRQRAPRPE